MGNTFIKYLITCAFMLVTFLWLMSYTHHTGFGIDHDFEQENNKVLHTFSRISWTGHGSVWLGYGSTVKDTSEVMTLEKLDVAAVFFRPVKTPLSSTASFWNRVGFWYIRGKSPKASLWIGVPSWLPVLLIGFMSLGLWQRR